METKKTKIGVIGLGYVGTPIQKWFREQGHEVFSYDKFKKEGSVEGVNKAEIIFIAVPTPFHEDGEGYDDSAVRESLQSIEDGKTIVIKSTIIPGSTRKYQEAYPTKTILYNPEFLRAKTAEEDYLHPNVQIVGYASEGGKKIAPSTLELLPKANFSEIVTSTEAEVLKYWANSYLATRVVFANEMHDLCEALGDADYNTIKNCLIHDPRIGDSHWDVDADGYRGFGGACFPKDVQAILQKAKELEVRLDIIGQAHETNKKYRRK